MKIRYKNFVIEDDRNGFILSTMGIAEKGENIGKEYIVAQVFPSTLERCLERIVKSIKLSKDEQIDLQGYIEQISTINSEFIKEIKKVCADIGPDNK